MQGFSGQNKFSWVTIFKECLRLVLDLVQILYSIALQCVFPVLLFNPRTSDLVWMKTEYSVHVSGVLPQPASFPPPHRWSCCAWLLLAGAWEAQRVSISPQFHACGAGEGSSLSPQHHGGMSAVHAASYFFHLNLGLLRSLFLQMWKLLQKKPNKFTQW